MQKEIAKSDLKERLFPQEYRRNSDYFFNVTRDKIILFSKIIIKTKSRILRKIFNPVYAS